MTETLSDFISDAEITASSENYNLGDPWASSTLAERKQALQSALDIWATIRWPVSPFDDAAFSARYGSSEKSRLKYPLLYHGKMILEKEGAPMSQCPDTVKLLLDKWIRFRVATGAKNGTT